MPEVLGYLRERVMTARFVLLGTLLSWVTVVLCFPRDLFAIAWALLSLVAWCVALRLWDDLVDLPHDRRQHPDRVLCRSRHVTSFGWFCTAAIVFAASLAICSQPRSILPVVALVATLAIWYRLRPASPVWNYHVVLCKYPVIVWVVSGCRPDGSHLAWLVCLYWLLCAVEVWHDGRLRQHRFAQRISLAELVFADGGRGRRGIHFRLLPGGANSCQPFHASGDHVRRFDHGVINDIWR